MELGVTAPEAVAPPTATPREAAGCIAAPFKARGYVPEALHAYTDAAGATLFWRLRLRHPERARAGSKGAKVIRPMSLIDAGYVGCEPAFDGPKPLYRLHELVARATEPVFVVEGEKCADALARLGLLATTSGAATSADRADWQPLAGREVIVWPDHDAAGLRYAAAVADTLRPLGSQVRIVDVEPLALPRGGDVVDWLAAHPSAVGDDILVLPCTAEPQAPARPASRRRAEHEPEDDTESRHSEATRLVSFVTNNATLLHDRNRHTYAQDRATGETRRIDGEGFQFWLASSYYAETGRVAREAAMREARATLSGIARRQGSLQQVHVRVAFEDGAWYLDLGEPNRNRAVRIVPGAWEVIEHGPVIFVRSDTSTPLPEPSRGGDLAPLWRLTNLPERYRLLVTVWLLECLRPETPCPLLELTGEQGCAKSSVQRMLRRLIDPNAADLRRLPASLEDLFVSAGLNWLLSFDNVHGLPAATQDALCTLATGTGFARRKLYTDADESVIVVKRPIVLNGIAPSVSALDLVDRTVSVELPLVNDRTELGELWRAYDEHHASMLGGLLDLFAAVLARLPAVQIDRHERPRLVEFARLGVALAQVEGLTGQHFL
jgi:hypothetical protein